MPVEELVKQFTYLKQNLQSREPLNKNIRSVTEKADFLNRVGLGYINLNRPAGTLSAGEAQRIRLASLMGNEMSGITVILDEPTRGMHPSEVHSLIDCLKELRTRGNTIVSVEHDPDVIRSADRIIDIGPGSGFHGGKILYQGPPGRMENTPTAICLSKRDRYPFVKHKKRNITEWFTIEGAAENNLQDVTANIPLGVLTGICGVSGSGKSTLCIDTIGRILSKKRHTTSVAREELTPGRYKRILNAPEYTMIVDQTKAGVYSPAKFMGLQKVFEKMYGEMEETQVMGFPKDIFSKRCSLCKGKGYTTRDMSFLPDMHIPCTGCKGYGFTPEVLDVVIRGNSLPGLLNLRVDEAYDIWKDVREVSKPLSALRTAGLGYLVLNQKFLSGGEAQRLKIAYQLAKKMKQRIALFILDEPTVGLHVADVAGLINTLRGMVDKGHSVIVVEHHPMMLASCDYLIELGPGGGPHGGRIIAEGVPDRIARGKTPIAKFLQKEFQGGMS